MQKSTNVTKYIKTKTDVTAYKCNNIQLKIYIHNKIQIDLIQMKQNKNVTKYKDGKIQKEHPSNQKFAMELPYIRVSIERLG